MSVIQSGEVSSMRMALPISAGTWASLVRANLAAVQAGWAAPGVFGTGIGPNYEPGAPGSLLYVGKSAGPLSAAVGLAYDQAESSRASTYWMTEFKNSSPFWQFVDKLDSTRRRIAWSNVCRMDRIGGNRPPSGAQWNAVAGPCLAALREEMVALRPRTAVFATSDAYASDLLRLLADLGYSPLAAQISDGHTTVLRHRSGAFAIKTRHPQGWNAQDRDRVLRSIRDCVAISEA